MDVSQYLDMFLDETKEHLQNLNDQIMHLEEEPEDEGTINEIFRAAHTLKGMAGTMGFQRMQTLTHDMENVFSEVRSGNLKVQPKIIDVLFSCLDALEEYTKNIQETSDEGTNDNEELIRALNECLKKEAPASQDKKTSTPKEKDKKTDEVPSQPAEKWEQVALNDTLKNAIKEARADGEECYGINVKIQEKCLLKAARAFLVVRTVGEKGEIIASNPSMADIEDEKFDWDFTLVVISSASLEEVIKAAGNVSEIENVTGGILDLDKAGVFLGKADADQEPKQKESEQTAAEKKEEQPSKA
nr:Hpt domain-containing protein [Acetatifactor sp.]